MPELGSPIERGLFTWEIQEARRVFAQSLNYDRVRIHENADWPNTIDRFGRWLRQMPAQSQPNAITLGFHSYFPVRLVDTLVHIDHAEFYKIGWLIHELTHAWQYQKMGWGYLLKALAAQQKYGSQAYEFGAEAGLIQSFAAGQKFDDFNLEQQGDICRTYYIRLAGGQDVSAWLPYVHEIQHG